MKTALVSGSSGFLGSHLVQRLKRAGYTVHGADRQYPQYGMVPDAFHHTDLRFIENAIALFAEPVDEVYDLAALVGGLGYIHSGNHAEIATNNTLCNLNMLQATLDHSDARYLFTSSAVVYPMRDQETANVTPLHEDAVFPADPAEGGYGWQKLYHEQLVGYTRDNDGLDVRIGRLHNSYGPFGTWTGGREKAPAAICRKVAEAEDGDEIEVWGDGEQTRSFCYVDDTVEGLYRLMQSDYQEPVNIGSERLVTINELVDIVARVAGKRITLRHDPAKPQGVRGRNASLDRARAVLDWEPQISLEGGLAITYDWIARQVAHAAKVAA